MFQSKSLPFLKDIDGKNITIVVAHYDDEIFFSMILKLFPEANIVHVTDGAPTDKEFWRGLRTRKAYASLRHRERTHALNVAGHIGKHKTMHVVDSTAASHMADISHRLSLLFVELDTSVVFTHAFEGGHPDHDAVAAAVNLAVKRSAKLIQIIEAPFYRMDGKDELWQRFIRYQDDKVYAIELDEGVRALKQGMIAAYMSQGGVLANVVGSAEWYRRAPEYDFTEPANNGNLSPHFKRAGIDEHTWRKFAREAFLQPA